MKGYSQPVGHHEDLPIAQEERQRVQDAVQEARENLRKSEQNLRAYVFTVETARGDRNVVNESVIELRGLLDALGDSCVGQTRQG